MKKSIRLAIAFIAVASFLAPLQASALSVADYEKQTPEQQDNSYSTLIKQTMKDAFQVDPDFGLAVGKYFTDIPKGSIAPIGYRDWQAAIMNAENAAKEGKENLNTLQIETIVAYLIQTNVLPGLAKKNAAPTPKRTANP